MTDDVYFHRVVSAALDVPEASAQQPSQLVFICTTPRTAGHALCNAMRAAGWGVPTEYFFPDFAMAMQARWMPPGPATFAGAMAQAAAYGGHLRARRTVNGIFAAKLFVMDLSFAEQALEVHGERARYVLLERADIVSQTISLAATLLTRRAFDGDYEVRALPRLQGTDDTGMIRLLHSLLQQNAQWERLLADKPATRVMRVTTEAFLGDRRGFLDRLGRKFSLPTPETDIESALTGSAYRIDRDLKQILHARFGALLAEAAGAR